MLELIPFNHQWGSHYPPGSYGAAWAEESSEGVSRDPAESFSPRSYPGVTACTHTAELSMARRAQTQQAALHEQHAIGDTPARQTDTQRGPVTQFHVTSHILRQRNVEIFAEKLKSENFSVYVQLPAANFNHRIETEITYPKKHLMKLSDEIKENEPEEEWKGMLHIYKLSTTCY